MGLFKMSLINKMLQDLEERRSEGEVVGSLHGQLRAVPESNRIHVAWWIVLMLAIMLTSVISWLWGRQTAPTVIMAQPITQPPQLALKLAPGLSGPQPALKNPAAEEKSESLPAVATPSSATKEADVKIASNNPSGETAHSITATVPASQPVSATASKPVSAAAPVHSSAPEMPATSLQAAPIREAVTAIAKGKAATPTAGQMEKASGFEMPVNVSKQMRELTPPQRAENEYRRAMSLLQQGRTAESMSALEQALQLDPQHSVARQTLVGLLLEGKRQDDAIRKLQDGLAIDRSQPGLAMMLARLQVEKGELRPAIDTLQKTLPFVSERADYLAFLAALFQRDARHKEAIENYLLALGKSPQNGLWWMGLAISLQAENRLSEARDSFGRAKASNSLSPDLLAFVEQKLNQLR